MWVAFWLSNLEKFNIKFPKIPKHGNFFCSHACDKYFANFVKPKLNTTEEGHSDFVSSAITNQSENTPK